MELLQHRTKVLFALFALAAALIYPGSARAQDTWGGSNDLWNVPGNWTSGTVPASGTDAIIDSGTANLAGSASGTSDNLTVGDSGTGALIVTSASLTTTGGVIGNNAGSNGSVTVNGAWTDSGTLIVGNSGTGELSLSGLQTSVSLGSGTGTLILASGAGSVGTLNIVGSVSNQGINAGAVSGGSGVSSVNFNLGFEQFYQGYVPFVGSLSLHVNGGGVLLNGSNSYTGGTFIENGDLEVNILNQGSADITVGINSGNNGEIRGAEITDRNTYLGINSGATGTIYFIGGTWNNLGSMYVGESGAGYIIMGGDEITGNVKTVFDPVITVGGGTGTVYLGCGPGSTGALNFYSGTLNAAVVTSGSGTGVVNLEPVDSSTFTPQITGEISVNVTETGTITLNNNETYAGTTTVYEGTLTVNGSIASSSTVVDGGLLNGSGATGNVTVNSGGYLGGTLSSGVVVVNAGGTVMAGDAPGANSMTSLTLSGSATYSEQIVVPAGGSYTGPGNHPVAGTDYGQTTLTGPGNHQVALMLDSANSILRLNVTGVLPAGGVAAAGTYNPAGGNSSLDNYFILHLSDATDTVSGEFAQVTADGMNFVAIDYSNNNLVGSGSVGTFTLNGQEWAISYTGNETTNSTLGGDDVVITAIPEPSTYALLALGGVALAMVARRRRVSL